MEVGMFENLSGLNGLEFLQAASAKELKDMLTSIRLPTQIISIYAIGNLHIAWIRTEAIIKKVKKEKSL